MKYLPVLLFFSFVSNAQQFDKQVDSLGWMSSGEDWGERIPTARRILIADPNNNYAHEYIVKTYVIHNQYDKAYSYIDSILSLAEPNPKVILALSYGLRHLAPKDSIYDSYYFKILRKCLNDDTVRGAAAYFLSYAYYRDFISPTRKIQPTTWDWKPDSALQYDMDFEIAELKGVPVDSIRLNREKSNVIFSTYQNSADSALKYLDILSTSRSNYCEVSKIPIAQLKAHLDQTSDYVLDSNLYNNHYLPEWYFGYLSEDWKNDLTNDLWSEMLVTSFRRVDFFSKHLQALNEPILFNEVVPTTYRLTWLPSFDHPIVIRIEFYDSQAYLTWKIGKGMGGYEPQGIKRKGRKKISAEEFKRIASILDSTVLSAEYSYYYLPMNDGASIIAERYVGDKMKAFKTNVLSKGATALLLELSAKYFRREKKKIEEYCN